MYHYVDVKTEYDISDDEESMNDDSLSNNLSQRKSLDDTDFKMTNKIRQIRNSIDKTNQTKENYKFSPLIIFQCKAGN